MDKDTMAKLIERGAILKRLEEKGITQKIAGLQLKLSERQIRRLKRRYAAGGAAGLIHGNFGKSSPQRIAEEIELKAIAWLKEFGPDFGSTFASEKLEEYLGIKVSVGTTRNWRIKHGIHIPRNKRAAQQFSRRERKAMFGVMLQVDGSPHDWFEGRGERCMLLTAIDDATGKITARFAEQEETQDLMILMRSYMEKYGRPLSIYTDHGGPYKVNTGNAEGDKLTQLGRAFKNLGIEHIHAGSPQAKGRVERNHGTNQDRLIKEMRLRNIRTIEVANKFLEDEYLPDFNSRFVVEPAHTQDAHRSLKGFNLDNIFCFEEKRLVQNDGIIQFQKHIFQITKNRIYAQAKSSVIVRTHLDGSITLWSKDVQLGYEELKARPIRQAAKSSYNNDKKPRVPSEASKRWCNGKYVPYRLRPERVNTVSK
jgi:transposase InsO family protein